MDRHRLTRRLTQRLLGRRLGVAGVFVASVVLLPVTGWDGVAAADTATIDGQFAATGPVVGGSSFVVQITGRGGVPATGVGAVALNVTVTNPTAASYLTAYPTGSPPPTAANLVFTAGQTVPNMVVVKVGGGGQVSLFNYAGATDVIVDVLGWFPVGASFTGLSPARLMDTRPAYPTIDGLFAGVGPVGSGTSKNLVVTGRGGVPIADVGAVALNVTVTNPTAPSFLTVWPTGAAMPTAANLNYVAGQSVPNMVMAKVGTDGQISMFNFSGTADVVVDVLGWFPPTGSFTGLTPARLMDTRSGYSTIDAQSVAAGPIGAGATSELIVVGRGGVPSAGVGAVALNVTVTNPTAPSFLTVFPAGSPRPTAANLNYVARQTVPNMVIVKVGNAGKISLFNFGGSADVIVDVLGWFPTGQAYTGLTPVRLMDSRLPPPISLAAIGPVRRLLLLRPELHQMGGLDRIAVWVCDVPTDTTSPAYAQDPTRLPVDAAAVAAWATAQAAPYFQRSSGGRYRTTFEPLGRIALTRSDGPDECLNRALAATGRPYTNVIAADTSWRGDGFGGAGLVSTSASQDINVFDVPPAKSGRGLWIGGGSVDSASLEALPSPSILAHEIGHTVRWPHSFSGLSGIEYDNPLDLMSGESTFNCRRDTGGGGFILWPCDAQGTLAFNRFAAGWIEEGQVAVHAGGTTSVTLDAPFSAGIQFLAAPDAADSRVMLTLEARPRTGLDQYLPAEGVAVHIVDQRPAACDTGSFFNGCLGADRRQQQVPYSASNTSAHVVAVGSTLTVAGVTITVTSRIGDGFTVQVSGQFVAPAPSPFA